MNNVSVKTIVEVATKRYFREHNTLDISKYGDWLANNIKL